MFAVQAKFPCYIHRIEDENKHCIMMKYRIRTFRNTIVDTRGRYSSKTMRCSEMLLKLMICGNIYT